MGGKLLVIMYDPVNIPSLRLESLNGSFTVHPSWKTNDPRQPSLGVAIKEFRDFVATFVLFFCRSKTILDMSKKFWNGPKMTFHC